MFQFGFGVGKEKGGKDKQKSKSTSLPPGYRGQSAANGGGGDDNQADFINNLNTYEVEERFEQMLVSTVFGNFQDVYLGII